MFGQQQISEQTVLVKGNVPVHTTRGKRQKDLYKEVFEVSREQCECNDVEINLLPVNKKKRMKAGSGPAALVAQSKSVLTCQANTIHTFPCCLSWIARVRS